MCLPAFAFCTEDFRERLRAAFPVGEAQKGWMSEQHDHPLTSKLFFLPF